MFEDQVIFVLLVDLGWVLEETIAELSSRIAPNQVEVEGLALLVRQGVPELIFVVVHDFVDGLFTLRSE